MKFFTNWRRKAAEQTAAEAARQQRDAYNEALTRIINQAPGWREPHPPADEQQDPR